MVMLCIDCILCDQLTIVLTPKEDGQSPKRKDDDPPLAKRQRLN